MRATASAERRAFSTYLRRVRAFRADGADRAQLVRAVAAGMLRDAGVTPHDPDAAFASAAALPVDDLLPPPQLRTPWVLGQLYEALLEPRSRHRAGAHYTPPHVARSLVAFAREGHEVAAPRVCDPAAGGGAFLLAAADTIATTDGIAPRDIVRHHCFGVDVDPVAVDVARASLALWAGEWPDELDEHLVVDDGLMADAAPCERCDLVVGNPPFQSQLGATTARSREEAESLRARFGDAVRAYVDTAALFLLAAIDLVAPGGRVALVQPHSTLVARDAARVRSQLLERARLVGVWFATQQVFDAGVRVWAPVLERPSETAAAANATAGILTCHAVARRVEPSFDPAPPAAPPASSDTTWAPLVADLTGVPIVSLQAAGRVGDLATATAGFRDEYYGLVDAVREHEPHEPHDDRGPHPKLVTAGLIDPLVCHWGALPARFARRRWRRPVVELDALHDDLARWVHAQLVTKLVVATQTRVLEVAVDADGDLVPSTPVIAVHAPAERLWHLAAAISAPPVSALAVRTVLGAALSADAVKLSARQVLDLPLPAHRAAWDAAAAAARAVPASRGDGRRRALERYGVAACEAFGVDPDAVMPWWLARLPARTEGSV
ncbi:MAG TPA: N-6 DNA methylase [Acidimicrobiales bacterium]